MKLISILVFIPTILFAQLPKDCATCATKLIETSQLQNIEIDNLRLLKNEIYARKGYTFTNPTFVEYFQKNDWYKPLSDNNSIQFSDIELKNIAIIQDQIKALVQNSEVPSNSKSKMLSAEKIAAIFTNQKKQELGIAFNIWKVYKYQDNTGDYYLVLTELKYKEPDVDNVYNSTIKAFNFKVEKDNWIKIFEINDAKNPQEESIFFWTKYIYVEDFDGDGIVEPIIIYGTEGINGYGDGRIKILLYYKGKKIGIRIQNGVLDGERNFAVDADFYAVPKKIQDKIIKQMQLMSENDLTILPSELEKKMKKKPLFLNDY